MPSINGAYELCAYPAHNVRMPRSVISSIRSTRSRAALLGLPVESWSTVMQAHARALDERVRAECVRRGIDYDQLCKRCVLDEPVPVEPKPKPLHNQSHRIGPNG
ncbi:MAG: hypothetical protein JKY67_00335 [Pseudomonadales bacterium]|nr:hypothetical protein [Pseudomonadales bacterium]